MRIDPESWSEPGVSNGLCAVACMLFAILAVSYTHLTLPTKRIV